MLSREELLGYLQADLGIDSSQIEGSTPLFSSGLIDSFSLVSLLSFVEKKCAFKVAPMEVNLDNMDSIERLMIFIERKTGGDAKA